MKLLVTSMSGNRLFTKAIRRLVPQLKQLEESFSGVTLEGEDFDEMIVSFVDASDYAEEIESRERVYHADVPIPYQERYKPAQDDELLSDMAKTVREVFENAPVKESTREKLLERFSKWENAIRQQSIRAV